METKKREREILFKEGVSWWLFKNRFSSTSHSQGEGLFRRVFLIEKSFKIKEPFSKTWGFNFGQVEGKVNFFASN